MFNNLFKNPILSKVQKIRKLEKGVTELNKERQSKLENIIVESANAEKQAMVDIETKILTLKNAIIKLKDSKEDVKKSISLEKDQKLSSCNLEYDNKVNKKKDEILRLSNLIEAEKNSAEEVLSLRENPSKTQLILVEKEILKKSSIQAPVKSKKATSKKVGTKKRLDESITIEDFKETPKNEKEIKKVEQKKSETKKTVKENTKTTK